MAPFRFHFYFLFFPFFPFFPCFPSFSFLSLCCCRWMFSGCNSRKGKGKCLCCTLQRSSMSWCCTTRTRIIMARMPLVGIVVAIVAPKGRGRQWDNQVPPPLAFTNEAFHTFQVQGWFGKFGRFKRFKIRDLKGVQFGPSFLFFDVIYQTYKLSLGPSKLAMCFLDIFQIFFIYI